MLDDKDKPIEPESKTEDSEPKRPPGRPVGSKSAPKFKVARTPRKGPADLKDPKSAVTRRHEDLNAVISHYNKNVAKRGEKLPPVPDPFLKKLDPTIPPEVCAGLISSGIDLTGWAMKVDSRPPPKTLANAGKAWSEASAYLPQISNVWVVVGAAILATVPCISPLVIEKRTGIKFKTNEKGELEPDTDDKPPAVDTPIVELSGGR